MYLTRITMNGFKSFSTKKELIIRPGITGVVGPNGSGKSNIADAIRWVLGEQSSKNLRGSKMEDVIFNGTDDVPKKGFCEVELVFDNSDGKANTEYSEVSVKRKMYRSGESEYSLNGTSCRLRDIVELFRDTGIGKEGYSIIGQGRIDEILNSKPAQRRRVFEEAAGIMKYRARKEEAERNLLKTQDNLVRIEDIIRELEMQVDPLKEQMDIAKRYLSLSERLKSLEVNLYLYNHDHIIDRINRTEIQQQENIEQSAECSNALTAATERLSELRKALSDIQQTIESSTADISELGNSQAELRGQYNLVLEKEKNLSQQRLDLENSVSEKTEAVNAANVSLDRIKSEIEKLNSEIDVYTEKIKALESDKTALQSEMDKADAALADCRNRANEARNSLEECRLTVSEKNVRLEALSSQIKQISSSDFDAVEECRKIENEVSNMKSVAQDLANEKQQLIESSNEATAEIAKLRTEYDNDVVALSELKIDISKKQSSVQLLSGLKDSYEGYASGIRALFSGKGSARLFGTVADVIKVPKDYETAIETLLGNQLQDVVTSTEADAKSAIEYLRRENAGRVTFLPVDSLQVKYLTEKEKSSVSHRIIGVASELVSCDEKVRPAIDFLLGRTVVVSSLDDAFEVMHASSYAMRAVTLKGDIVRPGGSVTGGSIDKNTHGFLKRNRMIEKLSSQIEADKSKMEILKSACESKKTALAEKEEARNSIISEIQKNDLGYTEIKAKLSALESQYELTMTKNRAVVEHLESLQNEYSEIESALSSGRELLDKLEKQYEAAFSELEKTESESRENSQNASGTLLAIQKEELARHELMRSKEKLLVESEHLGFDIRRNTDEAEAANERIFEIDRQLEQNLAEERRDILEKLDDVTLRLKNTSDSVQEIFARKDEMNAECEKLDASVSSLTEKQGSLIEQKYSLSAQLEKYRLRQEAVESRIWDDYNLTYTSALDYKTNDFSYTSGSREIDEIKEKLHGLGVVNPNAIEDFERVNERLQNLLVQKQDLEKASSDLHEVIRSLLSDMESCFNDRFELINASFKRIFAALFGGGRAELVILESEEASESGIDIIAEPPGKKLQSLSLLSGGEKALCAIALLFAMLDINPSPICLLDEIDAPLDDENLYRFSDYLKQLSSTLQFIVITHRKPTMSVCDTLYGIAMRKKGISEILSVDLK